MPRPLNESETLSFFHEYGRLAVPLSPSGTGGMVVLWETAGIPVLVYRAVDGRDFLTDISDLSPQQIANLGLPALAHGMLYNLPDAIIEAIGNLPENLADEAIWLADKIGKVAGAATKPLVGDWGPIVVAAIVVLALMYLPRSGH